MALTKKQRLDIFFERMARKIPAASREEARRLLDVTLIEVEDEHSGLPAKHPPPVFDDGRLYPAQDDHAEPVAGRPDLVVLEHRRHDTYIRDNGAILIVDRATGMVLLDAPGADGHRVELDDGPA